ncbi:MAG: hypothetical protein MUO54_14730 [Anaerolineales bacterium]|nr:hypothetical protein [Anaerolineales bacterium]
MSDPIEDFLEEKEQIAPVTKKRSGGGGCLLNVLSGIFVAGIVVVVLIFALIFINPQIGWNPLPPSTIPALVLTNTPTPTPKGVLPATWTPTLAPTITPTETLIPTDTPVPTPEETPIPAANLESGTSFSVQSGSPNHSENTIHTEAGCNWLGVAGQVFDSEGSPVSGILVESGGYLGDIEISGLTLTGMAPVYGDGGYEIILTDSPASSDGDIWIQLMDQANLPLSEKIYFQTFDSCDSNLVKINFEQNISE